MLAGGVPGDAGRGDKLSTVRKRRHSLQAWSGFLAGGIATGTFRPLMTVRRKLLGVAACVAAVLTLVSAVDAKGFRRYLRLRQDVEAIQERNRVLAEQNATLLREINALRNDPAALERAAREELGYVKPGELVFHLE